MSSFAIPSLSTVGAIMSIWGPGQLLCSASCAKYAYQEAKFGGSSEFTWKRP